jgi:hypothetical protein
MEVRSVDPRHASEEVNSPAYRVDFWGPTGAAEGDGGATIADENLLTGAADVRATRCCPGQTAWHRGGRPLFTPSIPASSAARDVSPSQGAVWAGNRKPRLIGSAIALGLDVANGLQRLHETVRVPR